MLSYTIFTWLVILHTFEEIACGIFDLQLGHVLMKKNRYLLAASGIASFNMLVMVLLILNLPIGLYLGLFASAVLGVLQGDQSTHVFDRGGADKMLDR